MSTAELHETSRGHLSTMTDEEWIRITDAMLAAYEAGDEKRADELSSMLPISLEAGLCAVKLMGRDALADFNTKDIEALYGPDWIERYGEASF